MDPNIMKFLEQDEDEPMHSGADVEAFAAALNRDIEENASTSRQPSDSNSAALSQGRSQTISLQTSGEQSIHIQEPPNPESESQTRKFRNISYRPPMMMGSNDQQPLSMEFKDQQSLSIVKGNPQTTSMGLNHEQVMSTVNPHTMGMASSSQQMVTPGMNNQQFMASSNQHTGTTLKSNNQGSFDMLFQIIQPYLDKDRARQLQTLYFKLKKNEISKDGFSRHMRSIAGPQLFEMALIKFQTDQAARNPQAAFQSQPQTSAQQMQVPSSAHMETDLSNKTNGSNTDHEVESQADSQVGQTPISSLGASSQERKHPVYPTQGINKHFPHQSSKSTSLGHKNTVSSSIPSPMEIKTLTNSQLPSLTSLGRGNKSKAPPKKPSVRQKKPMETPGPLPPSSKKQKVSGAFMEESIKDLNDVAAVSGVNLREEEEQLFSRPKEDSRVSEASRRVVQEEEERLLLQKIPLQKKVVEIMAKCGLKNMSSDMERCLSLCVEERLCGLISNVVRLSKQRVDIEKPRHNTIITSDVKQEIMTINRKARDVLEKKQAETEISQKPSEADKEEDNKTRATAANKAVRAATGVDDMVSRWQLMSEAHQKQKRESDASQPATSTRNSRENQESEKRDPLASFTAPASVRKLGRNRVFVPHEARSISVKDVIAVLEREPQMSKSALIYRLYNKVRADGASD